MTQFYQKYVEGFHQEVYTDLLQMKEHIYNDPLIYQDASLVVQEIMKRFHFNVETLQRHLGHLDFQFGKGGFWENVEPEKQSQMKKKYPIIGTTTKNVKAKVHTLAELVGSLPLSLISFFGEIGSINFIGLFPSSERSDGSLLDPLCIYSVDIALEMVTSMKQNGFWEEEPFLILSGDQFHKYGYSGSGTYNMELPYRGIDTLLLNEPHKTNFIDYLRICMKWGGFPGLEQESKITKGNLEYLTKDLIPF